MEGGVRVVKVGSIQIITYGPYLRIGNNADNKVWAIHKSGVGELIVLATITIVLLHAVE